MAFCEECGSRIPDDVAACPACGAPVYAEPTPQPAPQPRPHAPKHRATSFTMAEGEKIVRKYHCSNIKRPRCEGYLTVTNKRIVFEGKAAGSRIAKEVAIDSVSGLDSYYGRNISVIGIIIGVIFALFGLVAVFGDMNTLIGLLALVIGGLIIYASIKPCFFLNIFSSKATSAPISLGGGPKTMVGNGALYTLVSLPTSETDRMLNELGAIITDLQTLGDHAIEKWSR